MGVLDASIDKIMSIINLAGNKPVLKNGAAGPGSSIMTEKHPMVAVPNQY